MNATEKDLPRDVALGFWLFLESEKYRHMKDVEMIKFRQKEIAEKYEITFAERRNLYIKSKDFRTID